MKRAALPILLTTALTPFILAWALAQTQTTQGNVSITLAKDGDLTTPVVTFHNADAAIVVVHYWENGKKPYGPDLRTAVTVNFYPGQPVRATSVPNLDTIDVRLVKITETRVFPYNKTP